MDVDWNLDENGKLELRALAGFAIGTLPHRVLVIQLRIDHCEASNTPGRHFQVGMTVETARTFANLLLQTADEMEMASTQLN